MGGLVDNLNTAQRIGPSSSDTLMKLGETERTKYFSAGEWPRLLNNK